MSMSDDQLKESVGRWFKDALNTHGHVFQNALVKAIAGIRSQAGWTPWIPEFPVEVQGTHTRIDFVLINKRSDMYLVCECKRSNPALSNWCFAKSSFKPNNSLFNRSYMETLQYIGEGQIRAHVKELLPSDRIYQVAVEVKSAQKGDASSPGRGQIEEAATQVCRQLNGLMECFHKRKKIMDGRAHVSFLPVLFTTAKLWTTDLDLSTADLESGELELDTIPVKDVSWLWYQYHQSPGLKHSVPAANISTQLMDILFYEFVKPIAVVTPAGLEEFLCSQTWGY